MTEQKPLEPWQWPEAHWRKLVNQVRAGRSLRPKTWKNGARCAFAISFDSDHETNELREGGKSIGRMAWGQYGNRVGVPRILKLLKKYDVPGTFYVPAVAALLHPDEQRQVIAEGHEIGIHSWIHELNSVLPYEAEKDLMQRAADTLEKITGVRPVGARTASWDFSPHTLRIIKEMGLLYDSSLMADEDPPEPEAARARREGPRRAEQGARGDPRARRPHPRTGPQAAGQRPRLRGPHDPRHAALRQRRRAQGGDPKDAAPHALRPEAPYGCALSRPGQLA